MSNSIRPMLAVEGAPEVDLAASGVKSVLQFPVIAQVKFDGFRCIMPQGVPMTRTLKPISNSYVRRRLNGVLMSHSEMASDDHPLHGFDGEIIALNPEDLSEQDLHQTQSALNRRDGSPRFVYHVFDDFSDANMPYEKRQDKLNARLASLRQIASGRLETDISRLSKRIHDHVFQQVESRFCERIEDVLAFEAECLAWGAEGIMLKSPRGHYKFGRSTLREGLCLKVKRFIDDEAVIVDFIEKMHNLNEASIDARGYTERSSAKSGKVLAGTLGTLVLRWHGITFEIGTGWDAAVAQEIWNKRASHIGRKINFKYKGVGPNGKPLIPSFKGVRYDV